MKKQAVMMLSAALLLSACSDFSRYTTADADAPVKTRLRACMLSEANSRFQNGTLLTKTLSETADEISSVCLKSWLCNRPVWIPRPIRPLRRF